MSERETHHEVFFSELMALCAKHGAKIAGCGCCGSPWVSFDGDKAVYDCLVADGDAVVIYRNNEQMCFETGTAER